jgi:hypothetical protein
MELEIAEVLVRNDMKTVGSRKRIKPPLLRQSLFLILYTSFLGIPKGYSYIYMSRGLLKFD